MKTPATISPPRADSIKDITGGHLWIPGDLERRVSLGWLFSRSWRGAGSPQVDQLVQQVEPEGRPQRDRNHREQQTKDLAGNFARPRGMLPAERQVESRDLCESIGKLLIGVFPGINRGRGRAGRWRILLAPLGRRLRERRAQKGL